MIANILTGGFARGYRTYIIGALIVVDALAKFATGDMTAAEFWQQLPQILMGLGLNTLRAGVNK